MVSSASLKLLAQLQRCLAAPYESIPAPPPCRGRTPSLTDCRLPRLSALARRSGERLPRPVRLVHAGRVWLGFLLPRCHEPQFIRGRSSHLRRTPACPRPQPSTAREAGCCEVGEPPHDESHVVPSPTANAQSLTLHRSHAADRAPSSPLAALSRLPRHWFRAPEHADSDVPPAISTPSPRATARQCTPRPLACSQAAPTREGSPPCHGIPKYPRMMITCPGTHHIPMPLPKSTAAGAYSSR